MKSESQKLFTGVKCSSLEKLTDKVDINNLRCKYIALELNLLRDIQAELVHDDFDGRNTMSIRLKSLTMDYSDTNAHRLPVLLSPIATLHDNIQTASLSQLHLYFCKTIPDENTDGKIVKEYLTLFIKRFNSIDSQKYLLKILREATNDLERTILIEK